MALDRDFDLQELDQRRHVLLERLAEATRAATLGTDPTPPPQVVNYERQGYAVTHEGLLDKETGQVVAVPTVEPGSVAAIQGELATVERLIDEAISLVVRRALDRQYRDGQAERTQTGLEVLKDAVEQPSPAGDDGLDHGPPVAGGSDHVTPAATDAVVLVGQPDPHGAVVKSLDGGGDPLVGAALISVAVGQAASRAMESHDLLGVVRDALDLADKAGISMVDTIKDVGKALVDKVEEITDLVVAGMSEPERNDAEDRAATGQARIEHKAEDLAKDNNAFETRIATEPQDRRDELKHARVEVQARILVVVAEKVVGEISQPTREDVDELHKHR